MNFYSKLNKVLVAAITFLVIAFIYSLFHSPKEIFVPPGQIAPEEPYQEKIYDSSPVVYGDFIMTPVSRFSFTARVLSTKKYLSGKEAEVSPWDLAVGWGIMSDSSILNGLSGTRHSGRFYYIRWDGSPPAPKKEMMRSITNIHIAFPSKETQDKIKKAKKGQLVVADGYLVNVATVDNNWRWNTSTVRSDIGWGACEIFYIKNIHFLDP